MEAKIKSIQEEEFPARRVGSLMNCCKPNWYMITSIFKPSQNVVSFLYQVVVFPLKSPMATIKKRLLFVSVSKVNSRLSVNVSKMSSV